MIIGFLFLKSTRRKSRFSLPLATITMD